MAERHVISVAGDELVAVHHPCESEHWIIFSHGFVSDKLGSYEGRSERSVVEGYNAVRFDHRGCGESDLDFTDTTLSSRIADLKAVIDYFDPERVVLFGSSFGGKVVFHTAPDESGVHAIATRAPLTYTTDFDKYRPGDGANSTGFGHEFFSDFDSYPFDSAGEDISVPVAIFHGRQDETIPISSSVRAVEELETDVFFQAYRTGEHNFSRELEDRMRDQLFSWLSLIKG